MKIEANIRDFDTISEEKMSWKILNNRFTVHIFDVNPQP